MPKEGPVLPGTQMTIRVFYPNPVISPSQPWQGIDFISQSYKVIDLVRYDPIYHELVFIDDKIVRHHIIGLAYHLEETLQDPGGIDVQA